MIARWPIRATTLVIGVAVSLAVSGCSDHGTEPTGGGTSPLPSVSFAADLQPVFDTNCVGCHGVGGNGGLDVRPCQAWGNLVGVASTGYAQQRVVPNNPALSLLYLKLSGAAGVNDRMPLGGTLSPAEIEDFRIWILEGALNN